MRKRSAERYQEEFLLYCGTKEPDEYHIRNAARFVDEVKSPHLAIGQKNLDVIRSRPAHNIPPSARDGAGMLWLRLFADYDGDKCLLFQFRTAYSPSGRVTFNSKPMTATRAMCLHVHKLSKDRTKTMALHKCGNGHLACVTPKHLYWGDKSDNANDAKRHAVEGKQAA